LMEIWTDIIVYIPNIMIHNGFASVANGITASTASTFHNPPNL